MSRRAIRTLASSILAGLIVLFPRHAQAESQVVATAVQLGITPEAIVVAGLAEHAHGILVQLEAAQGQRAALALAGELEDAASANVSLLWYQASSVPGDVEVVDAYGEAVSELNSIRAQIEQIQAELLEEATLGLPSALVQHLAVYREAATRKVPYEFRIKQRTASEWIAVERALRAEQRAARLNTSTPPEDAEVLAQVRTETEVVAALERLGDHLGSVRQLFAAYQDQT